MPHDEREEIGKELHRLYEEGLIKHGGDDLRIHFNKRDKTVVLSQYQMLITKAQKALS
jgi:hypothetical protein